METTTTSNVTEGVNVSGATPSAQEILSRVGVAQNGPAQEPTQDSALAELKNIKLDDIKDPVARQLVEKRLKDMESGVNKKFEEIARLRKDLESQKSESNSWTPEKLDRVLKDPSFAQLVQARFQTAQANQAPAGFDGTNEEWSALTPEEKQQFAQLNQKVAAQEQFMIGLLRSQEDEKLKTSYPDYDPKVVDQIQNDLLSGRLQATREHLWKVANFESAVQRAYQLGREDRKTNVNEKLNASNNLPQHNVTVSGDVPEEIRKQGIPAIAKWRKQQLSLGKN